MDALRQLLAAREFADALNKIVLFLLLVVLAAFTKWLWCDRDGGDDEPV